MVDVLVMLSTYNGERYIKEQLDSLYKQKNVNIYIVIRDDGSTDGTVNILKEYKSKYGKMTVSVEDNIGCKRSFYKLIQMASTMEKSFDYYAFCDQDDVWDDDKLISAVKMLEQSNNEYRLYYSAARCVDNDMNLVKVLPINTGDSLASIIISSHSLGCTQVFNKAVLLKANHINEIILPSISVGDYIPQHDTWVLVTAKSLGGYIFYDSDSHINYRQHAGNVVGGGSKSMLSILRLRLSRHLSHPNMRSCLAFYALKAYAGYLPDEANRTLDQLAEYKSSFNRRIKLMMSKEMRTGNVSIDIPMKFMVVLGKF